MGISWIFLSPSQCGKIRYTVEKNGVKKPWWNINSYDIRMLNHQKNKKFPDQILQKSTRGNWPWSKTHRIKKPTPLWKTNFLRCTTLRFNQKLFVNPEGGNKHFVFFSSDKKRCTRICNVSYRSWKKTKCLFPPSESTYNFGLKGKVVHLKKLVFQSGVGFSIWFNLDLSQPFCSWELLVDFWRILSGNFLFFW